MKLVLGMEVGMSPGDFVLDGDPVPLPNFRSISIVAKRLDALRCHLVLMFDVVVYCNLANQPCEPPPTPHKGGGATSPIFGHVYCGQMAGWMKPPLGTEGDLGPGHIVLDGVPAPAKGAQQLPSFRPVSIVATIAHLSYC